MKIETVRGSKISKLVKTRGLKVKGFRRALHQLVADFCEDESEVECEFGEWFGNIRIFPAAYRIDQDGDGIWDVTIHVYEVEKSVQLSKERIAAYGRIADGDGPLIELHIVDRFGQEHLLDNDMLMCFAFYRIGRDEKYYDDILSSVRAVENLPVGARTSKWKAAYDALREMGIEI